MQRLLSSLSMSRDQHDSGRGIQVGANNRTPFSRPASPADPYNDPFLHIHSDSNTATSGGTLPNDDNRTSQSNSNLPSPAPRFADNSGSRNNVANGLPPSSQRSAPQQQQQQQQQPRCSQNVGQEYFSPLPPAPFSTPLGIPEGIASPPTMTVSPKLNRPSPTRMPQQQLQQQPVPMPSMYNPTPMDSYGYPNQDMNIYGASDRRRLSSDEYQQQPQQQQQPQSMLRRSAPENNNPVNNRLSLQSRSDSFYSMPVHGPPSVPQYAGMTNEWNRPAVVDPYTNNVMPVNTNNVVAPIASLDEFNDQVSNLMRQGYSYQDAYAYVYQWLYGDVTATGTYHSMPAPMPPIESPPSYPPISSPAITTSYGRTSTSIYNRSRDLDDDNDAVLERALRLSLEEEVNRLNKKATTEVNIEQANEEALQLALMKSMEERADHSRERFLVTGVNMTDIERANEEALNAAILASLEETSSKPTVPVNQNTGYTMKTLLLRQQPTNSLHHSTTTMTTTTTTTMNAPPRVVTVPQSLNVNCVIPQKPGKQRIISKHGRSMSDINAEMSPLTSASTSNKLMSGSQSTHNHNHYHQHEPVQYQYQQQYQQQQYQQQQHYHYQHSPIDFSTLDNTIAVQQQHRQHSHSHDHIQPDLSTYKVSSPRMYSTQSSTSNSDKVHTPPDLAIYHQYEHNNEDNQPFVHVHPELMSRQVPINHNRQAKMLMTENEHKLDDNDDDFNNSSAIRLTASNDSDDRIHSGRFESNYQEMPVRRAFNSVSHHHIQQAAVRGPPIEELSVSNLSLHRQQQQQQQHRRPYVDVEELFPTTEEVVDGESDLSDLSDNH